MPYVTAMYNPGTYPSRQGIPNDGGYNVPTNIQLDPSNFPVIEATSPANFEAIAGFRTQACVLTRSRDPLPA